MSMLRNLGVDQQVALLFVIVFGLLMLATAAVVGWSLRHPEASNGATGRHLKRDLRALWTGERVSFEAACRTQFETARTITQALGGSLPEPTFPLAPLRGKRPPARPS